MATTKKRTRTQSPVGTLKSALNRRINLAIGFCSDMDEVRQLMTALEATCNESIRKNFELAAEVDGE